MSKNTQVNISILKLDLKNFRTTPQKDEIGAIKAMISIKPEKFYGLMESILEDGYLHTENIIVLNTTNGNIVAEGNRRVACLKLIHQKYDIEDFDIPLAITTKIKSVTPDWLTANCEVSCIIYEEPEYPIAERIVSLTHAKGEKAGRDKWTSVATARHNRDVNKKQEPILDLLEKYLKEGKNLSTQQKEKWAGDYNLTVLNEAISKILSRLEVENITEIPNKYPKIKYRAELEELIRDIGLEKVTFPIIRSTSEDFALAYSILPQAAIVSPPNNTLEAKTPNQVGVLSLKELADITHNTSGHTVKTESTATAATALSTSLATKTKVPKALASNDPKYVSKLLKSFIPRGNNRTKVVALKNELLKLKIADNPIAFCFVLRSMFEISAKAYFTDHSLAGTKPNGNDKTLVEMLTEAKNHLTSGNSNKALVKILHGAMVEISTPDRLLSVTSMNQLVHNPNFSITQNDICILFGNIYPFLEHLN